MITFLWKMGVIIWIFHLCSPAWAGNDARLVLLPRGCSSFIIYRTTVNHPTLEEPDHRWGAARVKVSTHGLL